MFNTISARQLQREYKRVFEKANKLGEPIIAMANNKPLGAVISLDLLEKFRLNAAFHEAIVEYKAGKTKKISTEEELEKEFAELRKIAGIDINTIKNRKVSKSKK